MRIRRPALTKIGTCLFGLVVLGIAVTLAVSFGTQTAADDLHAQVMLARGAAPETPRNFIGGWLSARVAPDVRAADAAALDQRAQELDHRADRTRELAAAVSVAGLVLALGTAKPESRHANVQSASTALASTRSNGTV